MRRGRGKAVQRPDLSATEGTIVTNNQKQTSFSIQEFTIGPGQSLRVSQEIMENEAMKKWLRQGLLKIDKPSKPFRRYIGNRPMRVLHFVHTLFGGGAEWSTMEIHNGLKRYNIVQCLVNLYYGGDENKMLSEKAKSIFDIFFECPVEGGWTSLKSRNIIMKALREFDPDIVLYANIDAIPKFVHELISRPPIIQIQHSELDGTINCYRHGMVDAVVTVSETMGRNRIRDSRIPAGDIFPIWYGVNPARVTYGKSLREEIGLKEDDFIVGMVGNLNSLKRPLFGIEALAKCMGQDIHLVLSGNPQDEKQARDRADALGVADRVHILGYRKDVENIYATIDVLLNCSISEGLPMTIIEAMFNRLPVIATAVGGSQEVVLHGLTGYLYSINDQASLVKHIMELYNRKSVRKKMGKAGLERANQHFHIDVCAARYWEFFNTFVVGMQDVRCSVIMPVYNGEETVLDAINSVLRQTMPFFEFIIIDDGSEDKTLEILHEKALLDDRIKVIHQPHVGIVEALNKGIGEAKTGLIARIDADDEMLPDRLEKQLAYLGEHPEIDILATNMICRTMDKKIIKITECPSEHDEIVEGLKITNIIGHPSVVYRKKVWQAAGGYSGIGMAEDFILWTDAVAMGFKFHIMEEPLTIYGLSHRGDQVYHQWIQGNRQELIARMKGRLDSKEKIYSSPLTLIPLSGESDV